MASLDSDALHDYLSEVARSGRKITEDAVAQHFGVEIGAVRKRFGLLTGNCVLEETGTRGEYECRNVLGCTKQAFDSAGSQGKTNQAYVRALLAEIARLAKNNDTMRDKILKLNARLLGRSAGCPPQAGHGSSLRGARNPAVH
jgi:hypothetical protein